jgi:hypothetical protein
MELFGNLTPLPLWSQGGAAKIDPPCKPINLPHPEPSPVAVDGAALLEALSSTTRDCVIVSDVQADAVALWSVHTHAHDASDVSPKLVLKSVQKRSGCNPIPSFLQSLRIVVSPKPNCLATAAALGFFLSAAMIFVRSALVIARLVMFLLPLAGRLAVRR